MNFESISTICAFPTSTTCSNAINKIDQDHVSYFSYDHFVRYIIIIYMYVRSCSFQHYTWNCMKTRAYCTSKICSEKFIGQYSYKTRGISTNSYFVHDLQRGREQGNVSIQCTFILHTRTPCIILQNINYANVFELAYFYA